MRSFISSLPLVMQGEMMSHTAASAMSGVHDDGESAARAAENRHEVEIEETEQAPVQRAEKYKNVSDNVCNFHSF